MSSINLQTEMYSYFLDHLIFLIRLKLDEDILTHISEYVGDVIMETLLECEHGLKIGSKKFSSCSVQIRELRFQLIYKSFIGISALIGFKFGLLKFQLRISRIGF